MNLPSRGDADSATTTRYVGWFLLPNRLKRILTTLHLLSLANWNLKPFRHALPAAELLHHLLHLTELIQQLVYFLNRGSASQGKAPSATTVQ